MRLLFGGCDRAHACLGPHTFAMGTPPGIAPSVLTSRAPSPLLEREVELELVERLLAGARAGRGALLLFDGPAGIGKTRLLGVVRDGAEALGFDVLRARGGELERQFSHGVVRQLFEPRLARAGGEDRAALSAARPHSRGRPSSSSVPIRRQRRTATT